MTITLCFFQRQQNTSNFSGNVAATTTVTQQHTSAVLATGSADLNGANPEQNYTQGMHNYHNNHKPSQANGMLKI